MKRRIAFIALLVLVATGLTTASSFTTATLSRDANIDVVNDAEGIIALIDGNSGGIVYNGSNGELKIDFAVGSGQGVNVDSRYELGDPNDPSQRAFNITNHDSVTHTIELDYTLNSDDGNSYDNVQFQVYDSGGGSVATATEESGPVTFSANSGETFAVVIVVDTTSGVTNSSDLSGTLDVTAT